MQDPAIYFIPCYIIMERTLDLYTSKFNVSGTVLCMWSYLEHHRFVYLQKSSLPPQIKVVTCSMFWLSPKLYMGFVW